MQQLTETSENLASAVRIGFLLAEGFDFYALPLRWNPCAKPTTWPAAWSANGRY